MAKVVKNKRKMQMGGLIPPMVFPNLNLAPKVKKVKPTNKKTSSKTTPNKEKSQMQKEYDRRYNAPIMKKGGKVKSKSKCDACK